LYFKSLLEGINDQLGYNLEKKYALNWEKKQKKRQAAQKAKEAELAAESSEDGEEPAEGQEDSSPEEAKNIKFNIDYFSWILQHPEFTLTARDIIDNNMDKIRNSYIIEQ
jgi:hypothetical protein